MAYDNATLKSIYARTTGYCHICHKKLSFTNYARPGRKGAWEVEHSLPRSKGGTDHGNNLLAACIDCNREKSDLTTRTARGWHGNERRKEKRTSNTIVGAVIGGLIGLAGGPVGVALGALVGGGVGNSLKPE